MSGLHSRVFGGLLGSLVSIQGAAVLALPPPSDLPEEYLRTRIIFEARSPLTGESLTATDYAELLQDTEQERRSQENTAYIKPELQETVFLLRLLKLLRIFGVRLK